MLSELFSTIKTVFIFAIIFIVVVAAIVIGKGLEEQREREQRHEEERQKRRAKQQKRRTDIDRIKAASQRWSREYKVQMSSYLWKSWHDTVDPLIELYGDKFDSADETVLVRINIDGAMELFELDWKALVELDSYLR